MLKKKTTFSGIEFLRKKKIILENERETEKIFKNKLNPLSAKIFIKEKILVS